MPPFIKSTPSNAISVRASIDRLVLGSIPDAGFGGDVGFHGPKRYDWAQMAGTFKYTLWRLQQRVVGQGPGRCAGPGAAQPHRPRRSDRRATWAAARAACVGAAAMIERLPISWCAWSGSGIDTDCGCRQRVWC